MSEAARVAALAAPHGLRLLGAFHAVPEDAVPAFADGRPTATLLLLGNAGDSLWPAFSVSAELADGRPDPLDRWSRRVLGALAETTGGAALFPFEGPPWLPFQRWARRGGPFFASPLGPLIHPRYGLWHAFRGALAYAEAVPLPPAEAGVSPCETCLDRPCLATCPVDAFAPGRYDVAACARHIAAAAGLSCLGGGCRARRACPAGADHRYSPAQQRHHMTAFLAARRRDVGSG